MKKLLLVLLVLGLVIGVAYAANETFEDTYTDLSTTQVDRLNQVGAPSAIPSAQRVNLGTLLDETVNGASRIDVYKAICAPASGADSGCVMAIIDARSQNDCGAAGNVGGGLYTNLCFSDGTNWIDLT